MSSLISIIIPTYNRAHLISETLDSVLAQTYENWECIIVDDGSTDNILDVVKKYKNKDKRFQFYKRPDNKYKGPSSCRNYGLLKSVGKYVIFLDSDDLLLETCLGNRLLFASENNNFDFWIFTTKMFHKHILDEHKIFNKTQFSYDDSDYLSNFLSGICPYCVMGPLWRREALEFLGGFDEQLIILEDPDLHIRAYINGLKSLVSHEGNPDSFYRIAEDIKFAYSDSNRLEKFDSACLFYSKYIKKYNLQIKHNSKYFFKSTIFVNSNSIITLRYYIIFISCGFFGLKQIFLIPIAIILKAVRLHKVKGIGYYSFNNFIYK